MNEHRTTISFEHGRPTVLVPPEMLAAVGLPSAGITLECGNGQMLVRRNAYPDLEVPDEIMCDLGWDEGTEVLIRVVGNDLVFEAAP